MKPDDDNASVMSVQCSAVAKSYCSSGPVATTAA